MENTDITDQAVEAPEVNEKGPLSGFEEFSIEEEPEVPTEVDTPETVNETKESEDSEESEESKEDTSEELESKEESEEIKETPEEEPDFSFKAPEKTEEVSEEISETWKNIGEDLELSVEGEDFEDFKKAFQSKLDKVKEEAYNKAKEELPVIPDNIDPETKNLLELAQNGIDLKEYLDPINQIDSYLKYDDKTLVEEDLKNIMNGQDRLYTDEQIASKIERLEDNEMLTDKADEIREGLIVEKDNISSRIVEEQSARREQAELQQKQAVEDQTNVFVNTVNTTNEFMGGKVQEEVKNHVTDLWRKGKIHEMFNDPQKIVDYVLYHTVGDQVLQQRENRSFSNGQSKAKKSLHNIPPVTTTGASRGVEDTLPEEAGDFSVWESAMKDARAE